MTMSEIKLGDQYIESNYYIYSVIGLGDTFTRDGVDFRNVMFYVTTKTGRHLGKEVKGIAIN